MIICRRETFCASHILYNPTLSQAQNDDLYGKCAQMHGHNYVIYVSLQGTVDSQTWYLMNLTDLKNIMKQYFIGLVDHRHLNEISLFEGVIPSAENIAIVYWKQLAIYLPFHVSLYQITLYETDNNYVTYNWI